MATFLLVHGGGHGGWCWEPVARLLRARGHAVHAPTLTGLAERRGEATVQTGLATHVADVCKVIADADLTGAILAGHSYGGMVATGVADRMAGRIACLAYLDAAIPHDGEALLDVSPGLAALAGTVREADGVPMALWPDAGALVIYGLADRPDLAWTHALLTPHPWRCFTDKLHFTDPQALASLPRAIVNCRATLSHRPAATVSRWSDAGFVRSIDTGHDLMLTDPDGTAALLDELADWTRR